MAVFTSVTEQELSTWLSNYSLGNLLELQGIASGIENTNYFVTTSNGRFVLTLFEKLGAKELPFYLNLMAHLARHGIPCPSPVADRHNQFLGELNGKPACIVSRLSGKSLINPALENCAAVGAMLGQMHVAGMGFDDPMINQRHALWRASAALQVLPFLKNQDVVLLQNEVAFHELHTLTALPQGVVHADLFRDNVLFDGDRVGGVIDFYFACNDSLLYDVAITVNDWCMAEGSKLDLARTRALLDAYHAVRPFDSQEAELWPIALRVAALRFWISRLFDMHIPREGELVNAHNPDQFKYILQQHIAANGTSISLLKQGL
jgi:homoserine kinase type II